MLLQSSVGEHKGGLGLRLATDLALPAFIGSRVETRPMVMKLLEAFGPAGLNQDAFAAIYDAQVDSCSSAFSAGLTDSAGVQALDFIDDARSEARIKSDSLQGHRQRIVHHNPSDSLIIPAGGVDPEQELTEGLQRHLSALADNQRIDELSTRLDAAHRWDDSRRVRELRDPSV